VRQVIGPQRSPLKQVPADEEYDVGTCAHRICAARGCGSCKTACKGIHWHEGCCVFDNGGVKHGFKCVAVDGWEGAWSSFLLTHGVG
jgi:hypothetical protein